MKETLSIGSLGYIFAPSGRNLDMEALLFSLLFLISLGTLNHDNNDSNKVFIYYLQRRIYVAHTSIDLQRAVRETCYEICCLSSFSCCPFFSLSHSNWCR